MIQHKITKPIGLTILVLINMLVLGIFAIPVLFCNSEVSDFESVALVENPEIQFTQITGFKWPQTTQVITSADTHGGFMRDGEFYLIFKTDQKILENWLSTPPWEVEKWHHGPVPPEIGHNTSFGKGNSMVIGSIGDGPYQYQGEGELIDFLKSDKIWYAARERCCNDKSLRFHNGELLIVDLNRQQVWLSSWDN